MFEDVDNRSKLERSGKSVEFSLVKNKLGEIFEELFQHEGHGSIDLNIRFLRRGQKEILIRCGREYRFVVDYIKHHN